MKNRLNIVEKFSTFLLIVDSERFTTQWKYETVLKNNIQNLTKSCKTTPELLAYEFLKKISQNSDDLEKKHLISYLQEPCFWASKQVYNRAVNMVKSLTLEECFLLGNEATIKPQNLLTRYDINGGSKITTYAQKRLNTIIADAIYQNRGWKLCSDWGLLKKTSKVKRREILTKIGGLTGDKLSEYLLVWQCFLDTYASLSPNKSRKLPPPNGKQLNLMTEKYNLLAPNLFSFSSILNVEEFEQRLNFCCQKARQFNNPLTISYPENFEVVAENNPLSYLEEKEDKKDFEKLNHILSKAFEKISLEGQSIFYLWLGLNLTQQEIVEIVQKTCPNFIKEQYQLSRQINKLRKFLLDTIINEKLEKKSKLSTKDIKNLKQPLEQWLSEYIELQLNVFCEECYQEILADKKINFNSHNSEKICQKLIIKVKEKMEKKLNLDFSFHPHINKNFALIIEQFLTKYLSDINQYN